MKPLLKIFAKKRKLFSQINIIKYLILFGFIMVIISCRDKDLFRTEDRLTYSKDTVFFDTIFTRIGSITKEVKIYNFTNDDIDIRSIHLSKGLNSQFRLNIDGFAGSQKENVKLRAQDSMYIFVEVTIDPTTDLNPMVVEDSIVVVTEDNIQYINLLAWGQNMKLFTLELLKTSTWTNERPYLIYLNVVVDTGEVLTIEAGSKVHFHRYSSLVIQGTLIVNGTKDNPVYFQGDRLDDVFEGYNYEDVPGQWGTIIFTDESQNNIINYAIIKNATAGMQIGEPSKLTRPDVTISNTIIDNTSGSGIISWGATINAYNTIVSNCGTESLALFGGTYDFVHCTIANYWDLFKTFSNRNRPAVIISNYAVYPFYNEENEEWENKYFIEDLDRAEFKNCIIFGNLEDEILVADTSAAKLENCNFDYNLIRLSTKAQELNADYLGTNFFNLKPEKDSLFISITQRDYSLDTLSYAIDLGNLNYARQIPVDYNGNNRTLDNKPDLGAYEFQK